MEKLAQELGISISSPITAEKWSNFVDIFYPVIDTKMARAFLDCAPKDAPKDVIFLLNIRAWPQAQAPQGQR